MPERDIFLQLQALAKVKFDDSSEIQTRILETLNQIFDPFPKDLTAMETNELLFDLLQDAEPETAQHSLEVSEIALQLLDQVHQDYPERFAGGPASILLLYFAALLHDIGKIGILSIVNQPVNNRDDRKLRNRHADYTRYILQMFPSLDEVEPIASANHVRIHGGYPNDIKWGAIPELAKVLMVSDSFHSINHDRPGDPAQSPKYAFGLLGRNGFDHEVMSSFQKIYLKLPHNLYGLQP